MRACRCVLSLWRRCCTAWTSCASISIGWWTAASSNAVKGVATTEDEKAAMGALVFHLAAFPQAYDALRTSTAWATIAAEEDCATLLACLLKAAQAGALIVEGMLDMGHPDDAVSILSQLTTANEKMPGVASKSNAQLSAMLRRRWSAGAGDVVKYNGSRYWIVDDGHTNLTKTICLTPVRRAVAVAVAVQVALAAMLGDCRRRRLRLHVCHRL